MQNIQAHVIMCNDMVDYVYIGEREEAEKRMSLRKHISFDRFCRNIPGLEMKTYERMCHWHITNAMFEVDFNHERNT